jgi:arylesterase/paraoxonase
VGKLSPVEVYRVTNETSADKFYGSKYRVDRIYGNAGDQISCVTNAMVHGDWLYLNSIVGQHMLVCPYKSNV